MKNPKHSFQRLCTIKRFSKLTEDWDKQKGNHDVNWNNFSI